MSLDLFMCKFELSMMVNECAYAGANSFDFVEIYPETCGAQISAHMGTCLALYFLNGIARKRLEIK